MHLHPPVPSHSASLLVSVGVGWSLLHDGRYILNSSLGAKIRHVVGFPSNITRTVTFYPIYSVHLLSLNCRRSIIWNLAKISDITALGHQASIRAFGYETRKFQFSQVDDELLACVVRFVTSNQRACSGAVYSEMDIFMLTRRRAHIDGGHYQVIEAIYCTDLVRRNELDQHLPFHSAF
jgi:hypothetical protein